MCWLRGKEARLEKKRAQAYRLVTDSNAESIAEAG